MRRLKKIRSFTLMELVITMIIISITIPIAYYAYFMLSRQFLSHHHRSMEMNTFYLLTDAWQTDFDRAEAIRDTIDNYHFIFTTGNEEVRYEVGPSRIIRMLNGFPDTFRVTTGRPAVIMVDDSIPLVRAVTIPVIINGDSILLSGEKLYSSQEILAAETSAK